jgi:DNA-binding transcriptional LysR family regulator
MATPQLGSLDLNLILVFDALLRHRSVTRAAASLHVTQSAVSHSLRRLRTYFDDPLFSRSAAGVTPTALAQELSATVTQIAALVRGGLFSQAAFKPEVAHRTLTLCMTDLAEFSLLPTLIAALREASPGSTLHTVQAQPAETRALLESGEADLAIGAINLLPAAKGEIYGQKLYTQSNVVIAHRAAVPGPAIELDAYCELPHISIAPVRGRMSVVDDALARIGRRRRIVLTTEHHLIIPHLIRTDPTLVATGPRTMAAVCAGEPEIRILDMPVELPSFDVFQYWHERVQKDRFHAWFRNLIAHFFQNNPELDAPRP